MFFFFDFDLDDLPPVAQSTVVVGNGLSRAVKDPNGLSWGDLLNELSVRASIGRVALDGKPFPIVFEELVARTSNKPDEEELKEWVGELCARISANVLHSRLMGLGWQHVLTTNYDYALTPESREAQSPEIKHSLFRRHASSPTPVWQIHGEANRPKSILLGHTQYLAHAHRIDRYLRASPEMARKAADAEFRSSEAVTLLKTPKGSSSPLLDELDESERRARESWVDIFLTRPLHILGLGLDFSESVLWWLLSLRVRSDLQEDYGLDRGSFGGTPVVWWRPIRRGFNRGACPLAQVAMAMKIKTVWIELDGSPAQWSTAYSETMDRLEGGGR